ncbi:MAG: C40 family peptidase [Parasporobacterium sp.]|nr:C40 family peptidase [Parasporobacterium sp.]
MDKESRTGRTGQGSASGRSSPGSKLKTEESAKKASGKKLQGEKASQAAAGEKLRFDKAVFTDETVKEATSHGRKTPKGSHAATLLSDTVHHKIDQEADDNAGTDALNRGSQFAEHTAENGSNAFSRWRQKSEIKKEYAAAKAGKNAGTAASGAASGSAATAKNAGKAAKETKKVSERVGEFVSKHWHGLLIGGGILLVVMMISGMIGSCSVMFQGGSDVVVETSYTAEDEDILGVEADYCALEAALQARINNIESEFPGYDEINITQDQIGHNPYELASYLTVVFENYTRSQVQGTLQQIFAAQYELSFDSIVETRYRTETKTRTVTRTDPETGETYEEEEEYEEEVPYDYYILNVNLDNKGLANILLSAGLSDDQMMRYGLLMQTLGNKPDIFGDNPYAIAIQDVLHYDIPGEALTDEKFRKMITEAEKYLGYPYVWGGSSPSTSFDCSGFVSWVVNHCGNGWNVGRLTAEGLRQICAIIPRSEAKPGDLIFFQGTYNTTGASHVAIYVGNGMMIHCGNPIQYASIDTAYWQAHFYCFGRLP